MTYLKKERTIAERIASLDAFPAADTQRFINDVFVVGFLNETSLDGACRAELVFRAGIEGVWLRLKIAGTEFTVAAHSKFVNTFDR